jgi:uncharacterized protein YjbI with pentapeptide repeats
MIEPQRATVRPRVLCPESGEEIPLEDLVQSYLEGGLSRLLFLEGDAESVARAIQHLAFVFEGISEVKVFPGSSPAVAVRLHAPERKVVRCRLAPWRRDDWIEYLLAKHPEQCASVMRRLLQQKDADRFDGTPCLWQVLLDLLAADEALTSVQDAALRHVYSLFTDPAQLARIQATCLDASAVSLKNDPAWARTHPDSPLNALPQDLAAHQGLRLLVAADKLAKDLASGAACEGLSRQLPLDLVRVVARGVTSRPEAMAHLRKLVNKKRWAMAASVLHATGTGWLPARRHLPYLAGAYFCHAVWPEANLPKLLAYGADFSGADLRRAVLTDAILQNAKLPGACLQDALCTRMNADHANLTRADLSCLRAANAYFRAANLRGANLEGALLVDASLEKAHLEGARLTKADLRGARLEEAGLAGADLSGAILKGARLSGVALREAYCVGAVFAQADLVDCDLEEMELPAADFTEAVLGGALLTATLIPDGRFDGASLNNCGLADIDWERASLRDADLRGASFHLGSSRSGRVGSTIAGEGSKTGFYTDDYNEQDFKAPEEIRKANLCFADLRGANIENVDFYLVDLRGALLDPDQEEHVRRCGAIREARCG